jgi:hypothetical protein
MCIGRRMSRAQKTRDTLSSEKVYEHAPAYIYSLLAI